MVEAVPCVALADFINLMRRVEMIMSPLPTPDHYPEAVIYISKSHHLRHLFALQNGESIKKDRKKKKVPNSRYHPHLSHLMYPF